VKIKPRSVFVLLIFGLTCVAAGVYGEHQAALIRAAVLAERQASLLALDSNRDLAAIGIVDCGKLVLVEFIKRDGSHQIVDVPEASHRGGLNSRVTRIAREHVNVLVNRRPCGIGL
jgi:hypothetical protein